MLQWRFDTDHLSRPRSGGLYLSKLVPEGAAVHISNRYMNLFVIDRVATELKLTAFLRDDSEIGN